MMNIKDEILRHIQFVMSQGAIFAYLDNSGCSQDEISRVLSEMSQDGSIKRIEYLVPSSPTPNILYFPAGTIIR